MLCEKPVTFNEFSNEWMYSSNDDGATQTRVPTKEKDGPNEGSIVIGEIVSAFLHGEFADTDSYRVRFPKKVTNQTPSHVISVEHIVNHLTKGNVSLYYKNYRLTSEHIPNLKLLIGLLKLYDLETRFKNLLNL